LSLCCLGLPLGLAASGYLAGQESGARTVRGFAPGELQQSGDRASLAGKAGQQLRALTMNLAELEARMTRLDALGEHLTSVAGLEKGEFDFSEPPALGGPMLGGMSFKPSSAGFDNELGRFEAYLADRERQMQMLEALLANRKLERQGFLSGLPVRQGYLSSRYGWRNDPITGERAMHIGVDVAGKPGTEVVAAASGVVTWTGRDAGYGNLVEISHGDDLVTRYAHNKENLVQPGDIVRKGETIALMGSSGRATGSHVHFEIYKNGRSVDPSSYIARTQP
jgi:murein DD-endopeptidase MepM/ murein hydrolase activator NlpD